MSLLLISPPCISVFFCHKISKSCNEYKYHQVSQIQMNQPAPALRHALLSARLTHTHMFANTALVWTPSLNESHYYAGFCALLQLLITREKHRAAIHIKKGKMRENNRFKSSQTMALAGRTEVNSPGAMMSVSLALRHVASFCILHGALQGPPATRCGF